jgi:hypothetical protein
MGAIKAPFRELIVIRASRLSRLLASPRLYNRRNGLPMRSDSPSCFCRERRDDEGLYSPAVPDLHIDLL